MDRKPFTVRLDPKVHAAAKSAAAKHDPPRLERFIEDAILAFLPREFRKGLKS